MGFHGGSSLADADAQAAVDSSKPKQPPKDQRLFQAIGMVGAVVRGRSHDPGDPEGLLALSILVIVLREARGG